MDAERQSTERILAGCLLYEAKAIDVAISAGVKAGHFKDSTVALIVDKALEKHANGMPVDVLTMHNELGIDCEVMEEMLNEVPMVSNVGTYAETILNFAERDEGILLAKMQLRRLEKARPDDVAGVKLTNAAEQDKFMQSGKAVATCSLTEASKAWLDRMTAPDDAHTLLEWPVPSITKNMGRVDREVIWIVARESVGKTAFVIQWLLRLGLDGHTVSLASLESSRESVGSRAIANIGELDNFRIRQRSATKGLVDRAYKYADTIPECIRVIDSSMSLDQLYAWGKSEARRGSKLIVIDNTRHITVRGNIDRVNEVAEISSRMKQLRDETQIPVVILHHSTYDNKTGKEDVSWSKDIRRDADVIIFLKSDEELTELPQSMNDPGKWAVRFCVDKNREGRKGYDILTQFVKEHQLFKEWVY